MIRGETQSNPGSRFVREIPSELLDSAVTTVRRPVEPSFENITDFRPKAVLRPKVTAKADKPFIAKGIEGLNQLAGIQKASSGYQQEQLEYGVGDRVKHIKYGEGTVLTIAREPRDYKVTVLFDQAGQKIMYASFAKLKRV